ncbi:MAG: L-rhamnose isomerase, partial [Candidatus Poribacteria bacterium]|nr:L-rhamnose isomerase [Candidatus Poribacteria bacterium]
QDAATTHQYTGVAPTVALHIPWDKVSDWAGFKQYADELGIGIGAINPNVFQDQQYKLGSFCNPDAKVRQAAIDHFLECTEIMRITGSDLLSVWLADGTNYPGQDDFRKRKARLLEGLRAAYDDLPQGSRMLVEYKFFEPAFYHTDIPDWGTSLMLCQELGEQAQVLIDTGHHPQGTNVEMIVAWLLDAERLGGFHFNCRKYADDDLTTGSINPQELFLIFTELVREERNPDSTANIAYMIDQSHNVKPKIEAMIQSICNIQRAYAQALIVNRETLSAAQDACDIVAAEQVMLQAMNTDVEPLLRTIRLELGIDPDPLAAFRASGYLEKKAEERKHGPRTGWGS